MAAPAEEPAGDVLDVLVAAHREFRSFLRHRVGSEADAEDILQSAYGKGIERGHEIRDTESAVAWFYRLLRNAVADHYRRRGAEQRALEAAARDLPAAEGPALREAVCRRVDRLLPTLKEEYGMILRRVDLHGAAIADVALEQGITANNARVTLHRARKALRRQLEIACGTCTEHGCLDCSCGGEAQGV
ncbi:MAG TPA: sigma-70 family RNA polymerase sigma factor [Planctomycetota bacterium]|nr:sigma-70 family RNA polymerase sigma factor [Planctomycetota bacterium]